MTPGLGSSQLMPPLLLCGYRSLGSSCTTRTIEGEMGWIESEWFCGLRRTSAGPLFEAGWGEKCVGMRMRGMVFEAR